MVSENLSAPLFGTLLTAATSPVFLIGLVVGSLGSAISALPPRAFWVASRKSRNVGKQDFLGVTFNAVAAFASSSFDGCELWRRPQRGDFVVPSGDSPPRS